MSSKFLSQDSSGGSGLTTEQEGLLDGATSLNNVDSLVKRDASGNFSCGIITGDFQGALTGNADTSTNINITSNATNSYHKIPFTASGSGNSALLSENNLLYNPATTTLSVSNIGSTTLTGTLNTSDILPTITHTSDLGSTTKIWEQQYIKSILFYYVGSYKGDISATALGLDIYAGSTAVINIGRCSLNTSAIDDMTISHYDNGNSLVNCALSQTSLGDTTLNCKTGKEIYFKNNNIIRMTMTSGGELQLPRVKTDEIELKTTVGTDPHLAITSADTRCSGLLSCSALSASKDASTASYMGYSYVGYFNGLTDFGAFGHVDFQSTTGAHAFLQSASGATFVNSPSGQVINFQIAGYAKGYISGGGGNGQLNFTGSHKCCCKNISDENRFKDYTGYIVRSSGELYNMFKITESDPSKPQIDESLPLVELTNVEKDKTVFGVISGVDVVDEGNKSSFSWGAITMIEKTDFELRTRYNINSLGEGGIMVSNYNGNIENGDYITTCPLEGIGMKQDSEFLANYSVGKALISENFSKNYKIMKYGGKSYRYKLIGCTYHCG